MIEDIFVFDNGMVAICDNRRRQIPKLQGRCSERNQLLCYLVAKFPKIKLHGEIQFKKPGWEYGETDVNPLFLPMLVRSLE